MKRRQSSLRLRGELRAGRDGCRSVYGESASWQTEDALHAMRLRQFGRVLIARVRRTGSDELDAARGRANERHGLRLHHRRGHGHSDRQGKPHQHPTDDGTCFAQGVQATHAEDYDPAPASAPRMHTKLTRIKANTPAQAEHGDSHSRGLRMTPTDLHAYQLQLLTRRQILRDRLNALRGGEPSRAQASAAHFGHTESPRAQANTERDLELALDEQETAELRKIDAALQRIATGTYGQCVDCGCTISEARLRATPDAARCIDCQRSAENLEVG
jgi:DnaK suppressor protein